MKRNSNSTTTAHNLRVGNTPWFRRVRWALCCCCLTPAPGEEAGGSGLKVDAVLLHAWRWAEPPARPSAENKETHKPERKPCHLPISAFRSASLRFTPTTTTCGHRVPTELCPTGPVVFCGGASPSLPLFVYNMITHRWGCFASCLTTKTHHR